MSNSNPEAKVEVKSDLKSEVRCDVITCFGVLSESSRGWRKELKLVSWNERDPRFDIREWAPDSEKMSKGITLSRFELINLKEILNTLNLEEELLPS